MLREIGSSALTADWGVRALSGYDPRYDAQQPMRGAVRPDLTGSAATAHYRYHRAWAGYELVRDLVQASFEFAHGQLPETMSGAFYNVTNAARSEPFSATSPLLTALVSGMLGLHIDAPNRALSVEPHVPASWDGMTVNSIRAGRDRIRIEIRKEPGRYALTLRREGNGPALFVRLAPGLPLGARVARVRVNDRDAPIQVEETAHDVHAVVEVQLLTDAEIEIEYQGGLEISTTEPEQQIGAAARALRVLDVRREGSQIIILVEGVPAATYVLGLRSEARLRTVMGAELVQQQADRVWLRVRFGAAMTPVARREIRVPVS
jgi:hypothetical protein